jgi:hypothetical protein
MDMASLRLGSRGVDVLTNAGGSAYSSNPTPIASKPGVLPVKTFLNFTHVNVAAAKAKITQLNEELKSSSVRVHPVRGSGFC